MVYDIIYTNMYIMNSNQATSVKAFEADSQWQAMPGESAADAFLLWKNSRKGMMKFVSKTSREK
ncbi:hypothetical protein ASF12_22695 [Paenibacillus sp. Leaf72]|nr:hypothetical protein ASF12_22695 [Paenibacillus sp. Leaf72]